MIYLEIYFVILRCNYILKIHGIMFIEIGVDYMNKRIGMIGSIINVITVLLFAIFFAN